MTNIPQQKQDSQDNNGIRETIIGSTVDAARVGTSEAINNAMQGATGETASALKGLNTYTTVKLGVIDAVISGSQYYNEEMSKNGGDSASAKIVTGAQVLGNIGAVGAGATVGKIVGGGVGAVLGGIAGGAGGSAAGPVGIAIGAVAGANKGFHIGKTTGAVVGGVAGGYWYDYRNIENTRSTPSDLVGDVIRLTIKNTKDSKTNSNDEFNRHVNTEQGKNPSPDTSNSYKHGPNHSTPKDYKYNNYQPQYNTFNLNTYKPIFENYKPSFLNRPIFDLTNPFQKDRPTFDLTNPSQKDRLTFDLTKNFNKKNNYINDPYWLYLDRKSQKSLDLIMPRYWKTIEIFRKSVKDCLGSINCGYKTEDLIREAHKKVYGDDSFALLNVIYSARREAEKVAEDYFLGPFHAKLLTKDYKIGLWSHPLRKELAYAVSHVSPLVFDLNGDGVKLSPYTSGVYFDIDNDGFMERVGWASPEDGQLARDINKNGIIDDITELFGDDLISAFFKLSLLDSNNDKVIDEKDEKFGELLMWQDKNSNGFSEPDELKSLKELNIKSISLNTRPDNRVIEGNIITEVSEFTYNDGRTGEVADVHYHNDDMDSWFKGKEEPEEVNLDNVKYDAFIENFRYEVLASIGAKSTSLNENEMNTDWALEVIKTKAKKYIEQYKKEKEAETNKVLAQTNKSYRSKYSEHDATCGEKKRFLIEETIKKYDDRKKGEADKRLEELQNQLSQEIDNIKSANIQKYNQEKETLLKDINEKLKNANQESSNFLLNHFTSIRGTQQQYNDAVKAAFEANKQRFEKELDEQGKTIAEKYREIIAQESADKRKNFQEKYNDDIKLVVEELDNEQTGSITKNIHNIGQTCNTGSKNLKNLIQKEFNTFSKATIRDIEGFEKAIQRGANKVYQEWNEEILPQIIGLFNNEANEEKMSDDKPEDLENSDPSSNEPADKESNSQELNTQKQQYNTTNTHPTFKDIIYQNYNNVKIDPETLFMPQMRGYGEIPAFHIAMSHNFNLKQLVLDFMGLKPADFSQFYSRIESILYEWAGVSKIDENARTTAGGANIEARKVAFVERVTGQEFKQLGAAKFVGQHASTSVQKAWDIALYRAAKNLLVQGPLMTIFPKAEYSFKNDDMRLNSSFEEIVGTAKSFADQNNLGYEFWVQLGYILALSTIELNISIDEIKNKLSELAGEPIMIGQGTFGLMGDNNHNVIKGTSLSDYIKGFDGNDKLHGKAGSDYIEGDNGDDELYGDEGIDRLHGGDGNDKLYGGEGRDFLYGDAGNDQLYGEEGDDLLEGGEGSDLLDGGEGSNTVSYGLSSEGVNINLATGEASGGHANGDIIRNFQNIGGSEQDDTLTGDDNENYINGEGGNDKIYGGKGDDDLLGATGEDYLYGEEGDDTLTGFEGIDHMDGGEGVDMVSYHHPYAVHGVHVDLEKGYGIGGHAHEDTYKNIENIMGSKYGDSIQGDDNNNVLNGMEGDDTIYGGSIMVPSIWTEKKII